MSVSRVVEGRVAKLLAVRTDTHTLREALTAVAEVLHTAQHTQQSDVSAGTEAQTQVEAAHGGAQAFAFDLDGGGAGSSSVSLRAALDARACAAVESFLQRLEPVVSRIQSLGQEVADLQTACEKARDRIDRSEADTASFLSAAESLSSQRREAQAQLERVTSFLTQFELTDEENAALSAGPRTVDAGGSFFAAVDHIASIRAQSLSLLTTSDQALGLELLDAATRQQSQALDKLFEWTLPQCKDADALVAAPDDVADPDEITISLRGAAPSRRDGVHATLQGEEAAQRARMLRRGLKLLRATRPAYFRACQDATAAARRSALVKAFVRALSGTAAAGPNVAASSRPIDASAHDPLRYIGDMLAWVHLAAAEESELLQSLFGDIEEPQSGLATPAPTPLPEAGEPAAIAPSGSPSDTAPAVSLLTVRSMLGTITDGIAKPLKVRIDQMISSHAAASLVVLLRILDVLAFYFRTFADVLQDTSNSVTQAVLACAQKCTAVFSDLVRNHGAKMRGTSFALPADLSPSSVAVSTASLAEEVLQVYEKALCPPEQTAPASAAGEGAAPGNAAHASAPPTLPPVTDVLTDLLEPMLVTCRAGAEGLRLADTATHMLNTLAMLQNALTPHAGAASWVQRLASEISTWEETLVQQSANDILSACGMLNKLGAMKAAAEAGTTPPMCDRMGTMPEDLRPVINAFLAQLAAPSYVSLYDRVQSPRIRSRIRRDTGAVLAAAYARLHAQILDPAHGYTSRCEVAVLLRQTPEQVQLLADVQ